MSTIDTLKSTLGKRGGLAKANRFNVIFTPPTQSLLNLSPSAIIGVLAGGQSAKSLISDPRDISLLCQGATIPGQQITTIDYQAQKQVVPIPYAIIEEDVTLKFLLTSDYYIKRMMDDWVSSIVNLDTYQVGYKKDFACDVIIQQLDAENVPTYGVKLINAFPTSVTGIELDQAQESAAMELSVTMSYDRVETQGPLKSALSGIAAALDILS
jgi:hypothetical protein|tara:strand:+ start:847 stop:1482 length:636 start_codon:yes stop_codon:yes gene_type:complete